MPVETFSRRLARHMLDRIKVQIAEQGGQMRRFWLHRGKTGEMDMVFLEVEWS